MRAIEFDSLIDQAKSNPEIENVIKQLNAAIAKRQVTDRDALRLRGRIRIKSMRILGTDKRIY